MNEVTIYTDGSSKGNPGPGGYGAVLLSPGHRDEISAGFRLTTNNRMELLAVIESIKTLKSPCKINLYSDSKYVVDAFNKGWLRSWQKNGWKKKDNKPIMNPDLWKKLASLIKEHEHQVRFIWVKGHANNPENERCDQLAVKAAEGSDLHVDSEYEKSK